MKNGAFGKTIYDRLGMRLPEISSLQDYRRLDFKSAIFVETAHDVLLKWYLEFMPRADSLEELAEKWWAV